MTDSILLEVLTDVLLDLGLKGTLKFLKFRVELNWNSRLDGCYDTSFKQFIRRPFIEKRFPEVFILDVKIHALRFYPFLNVVIDIIR